MNGLRSAIGFLTILPLAPSRSNGSMASGKGWFPLVGLLLGVVLVGVEFLTFLAFGADIPGAPSGWITYDAVSIFPVALWSLLLVVTLAAMTRALHLDGFMDSCDALLGGFDRERRLSILRDSHVGAFAVIGVVCLLLLKLYALSGLPIDGSQRVPILLLFPCLSRWAMLLTMELFPYARGNGLGTAFFNADGRRIKWHLLFGFVFTLVVSVALAGIDGIVLLAAACVVAWGVGAWATKLLGGVTGDIYGAVNETTEVVLIILAVMLAAESPVFSYAPLPGMLWAALP